MKIVDKSIIKKLHLPDKFSHKGQNGKLLIIGGSNLFHGASLWALKTASRVVDMVFYLSTDKNQEYADYLNRELYDFINISFKDLHSYIKEADVILIGPGMIRTEFKSNRVLDFKLSKYNFANTKEVVKNLLHQYPHKKWVIDAGALQMMEAEWLKTLPEVIITPHHQEFISLFKNLDNDSLTKTLGATRRGSPGVKDNKQLQKLAQKYSCTILLKGPTDIICTPPKCMLNQTGNEAMTKGGTGDILAGLVAALYCQNEAWLAAAAGAYITGLAGDELKQELNTFFNASDLCEQVPKTIHRMLAK